MKTAIKIVFIALVVVFCSCTSEMQNYSETTNVWKISEDIETRVDNNAMTQFENPFKGLGSLHNQAMDTVKFKRIQIANVSQFTDGFTLRHADAIFGQREPLLNYSPQYIIDISKRTIAGGRTVEGKEICDSIILTTPHIWQTYLNRMKILIEEASRQDGGGNLNNNIIFNQLDIQTSNDKNLTAEYKGQLLAISAVTQASIEYNCSQTTVGVQNDWAETIVKADFEGAVCGALDYLFFGGSVTGLMFGPGGIVLSCGAYIVKGAILGSAVGVASRFLW